MDDLDDGPSAEESEQKAEKRRIVRYMARAIYRQNSKMEDADSTAEGRKEAYGEVRSDYRKLARKVLKSLERRGVEMRLNEPAADLDDDDDFDDAD